MPQPETATADVRRSTTANPYVVSNHQSVINHAYTQGLTEREY